MKNDVIRRPLVGLAFCYIIGTWLGFSSIISAFYIVLISSIFLLASILLIRLFPKSSISEGCIYLCAVFLAWSVALVHPLGVMTTLEMAGMAGKQVEVTGVVIGDPENKLLHEGGKSFWLFPMRIEELKRGEESRVLAAKSRINVRWYGPEWGHIPAYGELWQITGNVRRFSRNDNQGDIPLPSSYYLSAGWSGARYISSGHGWRFKERCYAAKELSGKYLSLGIEDYPEISGVIQSMLLGYKKRMSAELYDLFFYTSTLHIFAISGLNVVVVAAIIIFVLNALRIPRVYWVLFLAPLLIAYTIMTGATASVVRACVMAIVYYIAPLIGRKADTLSACAFSALVILAAAPAQLFDIGFICSFIVVIGLIEIYPLFEGPLRKLWEKDPLRLQSEYKWITVMRNAGRSLMSLIAASCSAWLVSAPLTAYFFGVFSPVGLLSNIPVVPISSLMVLAGSITLVIGSCVGLLADILNHANLALTVLLLGTVRLLRAIPYGSIEIVKPSAVLIILWYAVLAVAVFRIKKSQLSVEAETEITTDSADEHG